MPQAKRRPVAWLTYAWDDDQTGDIRFVAQELEDVGVTIGMDKWVLEAGKRLWDQIGGNITDPKRTDGWILYATEHSLASKACQEEYAYALDRALNKRGQHFPVIGLFPASVDADLIPPGIRTRLYVMLTDPDWKERVVGALAGRPPQLTRERVEPYEIRMHKLNNGGLHRWAIEARPRIGEWSPAWFAVPVGEQDRVKLHVLFGPRGRVPSGGVVTNAVSGTIGSRWHFEASQTTAATPTVSLYAICAELPTRFMFGIYEGASWEAELTPPGAP